MKQFYILLIALCFTSLGFGQPWLEDFESNPTTTYAATSVTISGRVWTKSQAGNFSYANTSAGSYGFTINDDNSNAHITTPSLNTCGTVSFKYAYINGNSTNVFQLQVSTDGTNFSTLDTHTLGASSNQTYVNYSFDVNNSSSSTYIRILSDNQNAHLFIDDFEVSAYSGSTETVDYCNLQFPGTQTITQGSTFDVFAQIYENGAVTNTEPAGQASDIEAWIGVSSTDASTVADFTSGDWTWTAMSYFGDIGNNDEYSLALGSSLAPGTFYYVSRFSVDGGAFAYGGNDVSDGDSGNFWDGTANVSGVLTVEAQLPDYINLQFPGSATITVGSTVTVYAQIFEAGNTPGAGAGTNITAEIGISAVDATTSADFGSGDWTWTTAPYLGEVGDNDEYSLDIGASLLPGTYYYVSRFSVDSGPYAYGGNDISDGDGGDKWNGTSFVSGVLTVNPKPEPTTLVTSFSATADSSSQITLTWNDNDGTQPADGFLVVGKTGAASFFSPVDGTEPSDDTDWSDDEFEAKVASGVQTYVVSGLSDNTQYDFKIYSYTNSGSNIDFKTDGTIPEDSATTFENPIVIITEIMQNPLDVADADGEYFEIYNPTSNPIDMNNWTISDNGSDSHTISSSVVVPAFGFVVLGINSDNGTNGGVNVDYVYSGFNLANGDDEIVLVDNNSNEVDTVEYDGGPIWPDPEGAAMIYEGSDIEDNNDGALWVEATISDGIDTDYGSPGKNGQDQIVSYLVYSGGAWNTTPSTSTGTKTALIKSGESTSFTSDISLDNLIIKEGAGLTVTTGNTLTSNDVTLESISNLYSSLILDGTIVGTVNYKRWVNSYSDDATANDNDLISPPLDDEPFSDFASNNSGSLLSQGSGLITYAFAPFNNNSGNYENYDSSTSVNLKAGKGYRVATSNPGTTLSFTGDVLSGFVSSGINDGTDPDFGYWNLIGNPYPSYIDFDTFYLDLATDNVLENGYVAIYGYDGDVSDGWTVWDNNTYGTGKLIAPGQGFFVRMSSLEPNPPRIDFTPSMRTIGSSDDFISGRSLNPDLVKAVFNLHSDSNIYSTNVYFRNENTRELDYGYDTAAYGGNANGIFTQLVENNTGLELYNQALSLADLDDVVIPLGIKADQGVQQTISLDVGSTIPENNYVYLEDNIANTWTLLNTGNYVFTPTNNLSGTGRFFLHFTTSTLTAKDNTLNGLQIYVDNSLRSVVIKGQLAARTQVAIYDLQGRQVVKQELNSAVTSNIIYINNLNTGLYIVELSNYSQIHSQKVIIR